MSRHKLGSEFTHTGTRWLPVGDLKIDTSKISPVQRDYDEAWGQWLAKNLDPEKLGVISVSMRRSVPYIIDGRHRSEAIKAVHGNNGTLVECKVYEGLDRAGEARLFSAINTARRSVSPLDSFLVSVTGQDPINVAIDEIVRSEGLSIKKTVADGVVRATGAMRTVYLGFVSENRRMADGTEPKPELLRATLQVIKGAWGDSRKAFDGGLIEGTGRLLAARWRAIDRKKLAAKLAPYPGGPHGLLGTARGRKSMLGGSVATNVAEVMLDTYNKGSRSDKVEALR